MDLALFDFDGTITDAPSYGEFVRFAVRFRRKLLALPLLAPVIVGYRLGLVSDARARSAITWAAFAGDDVGRIQQLGLCFAHERLGSFVRPHAIERIRWHINRGDRVVVVSASLDVYLESWAKDAGVEVLCSRLEQRGDRLTGRYVGADCCGAEKAARVRQAIPLSAYSDIYAYGDTEEDRELLQLATRRFFRWSEVDGMPSSSLRTRRGDYRSGR